MQRLDVLVKALISCRFRLYIAQAMAPKFDKKKAAQKKAVEPDAAGSACRKMGFQGYPMLSAGSEGQPRAFLNALRLRDWHERKITFCLEWGFPQNGHPGLQISNICTSCIIDIGTSFCFLVVDFHVHLKAFGCKSFSAFGGSCQGANSLSVSVIYCASDGAEV